MSDKKQHSGKPASDCVAEETKNEVKKCNDGDSIVFPDEERKSRGDDKMPTMENRSFAGSNENQGFGKDANGEVTETFD